MKRRNEIILSFALLLLCGCEKVIQADLDTAAPRLVVDASIDWIKNTEGNEQKIILSSSTGYYSTAFPPVPGAQVSVSNTQGSVFHFTESATAGEYRCSDFVPVAGETYTLNIISDGQSYTAVETLTAVPQLEDSVGQTNAGGMTGDEMEIQFAFQDDASRDDYYMSSIKTNRVAFPEYALESDEQFPGQRMLQFYSDKELKAGDSVHISLYGVSKRFFTYCGKLLLAAGNGGSPWQATPSAAQGNITNTDPGRSAALGYFRLSEVVVKTYTIR